MKKDYPLKKIMEAAGRDCDYNNRNFYFKSVNNVLETGLVTLEFQKPGLVWVKKDTGKQYNLRITAGGFTRKTMLNDFAPDTILRQIGGLLLHEGVKANIKSYVHLRSSDCEKCQGHGIIPQFHYYCSGICFDCGGSGMNIRNDKTTVELLTPVS